jgi:hypothetical protein
MGIIVKDILRAVKIRNSNEKEPVFFQSQCPESNRDTLICSQLRSLSATLASFSYLLIASP